MKLLAHPHNIAILLSKPEIVRQKIGGNSFDCLAFATPLDGVEVVENPKMEKEKWTGRWLRNSILPDDRFVTWLDNEDMMNPPSWAIYFGLVRKEMEMVFYILDTRTVYNPILHDPPKIYQDFGIRLRNKPLIANVTA